MGLQLLPPLGSAACFPYPVIELGSEFIKSFSKLSQPTAEKCSGPVLYDTAGPSRVSPDLVMGAWTHPLGGQGPRPGVRLEAQSMIGYWKQRATIYVSRNPLIRSVYRKLKKVPLFGAALQKLARFMVPKGTRVWLRLPAGLGEGLWVHLDPRLEMDYAKGAYEPLMQKAMASALAPGSVFYDVGAHIGVFSLIAARVVGKSGAVFAFEADPDNAQRIKEHACRNGLDQIHVVPCAVWSSPGKLAFQRAAVNSSRNRGAVANDPNLENEDLIEVEAISLDTFSRDHLKPTLMKIDIEGGEAAALQGSERIFTSHKPILICEVHNQASEEYVLRWLSSKRYGLTLLGEPNVFPRHLLARETR
jgi:FkbM family methyltransferase